MSAPSPQSATAAPAAPAPPARAEPSGAPAAPIAPDIALILDVAGAYFSHDPLPGGDHDPDHTGFNFQQLELSLGASVDPYFRLDSNLVFALDGVEVEEAYATTLDLPARLQLRAGQFFTRFGRINATHPHSWDFSDQPFVMTRVFGADGSRGLGVEASVLLPLPYHAELSASAMEAAGEDTARSFYGANDLGIHALDDFLYTVALKQFFPLSDSWSLLFGASGAFGPNSSGDTNNTNVYGADLYLKYRPITGPAPTVVSLQTEWLVRLRQVPNDLLHDYGGFAQVLWRFAERWATAGRYEFGSPAYDKSGAVTVDPLDPEWTSARHRVSGDVSFYPTEFSRLRAQLNRDIPTFRPGVWEAFIALEVLIGAHGAHAF